MPQFEWLDSDGHDRAISWRVMAVCIHPFDLKLECLEPARSASWSHWRQVRRIALFECTFPARVEDSVQPHEERRLVIEWAMPNLLDTRNLVALSYILCKQYWIARTNQDTTGLHQKRRHVTWKHSAARKWNARLRLWIHLCQWITGKLYKSSPRPLPNATEGRLGNRDPAKQKPCYRPWMSRTLKSQSARALAHSQKPWQTKCTAQQFNSSMYL